MQGMLDKTDPLTIYDKIIVLLGNFYVLRGAQRPASFAIICFCFGEFHAVSYSGSCAAQVAEFEQSMLVFLLPLMFRDIYLGVQKHVSYEPSFFVQTIFL